MEGGANTISRFIDADCVDRLHIVVSPVLIGSGRNGLELKSPSALASALRPKVTMRDLGGGDVLFECDFRVQGARAFRQIIYKITTDALWQQAQQIGRFTGAPVDLADGFIHFSSASQVVETAAKHFAGQADLWLLSVDAAQLGAALKWEVSRGGALFPHLYGDLSLDAIARAVPLARLSDGTLDFEDKL